MGLIAHEDDIAAVGELFGDITKFENGGDEDLPLVLFEEINQFLFAGSTSQIGNIHIIEVGSNLGLKIQTVVHDYDGRGFEFRLHAELLGCKYHEQGLTTSLEVPDETFLGIPRFHSLYDGICAFVLLVATDDLNLAMLLVCRIKSEEPHDVQHLCWLHHLSE